MGSLHGTPTVFPTLQGAPGSHPNKPLRRQQPTRAWCHEWGRGRGCPPTLLVGTPCPRLRGGGREHCLLPGGGDGPFPGLWGQGGPGAAQGQCWPLGAPDLRTWGGLWGTWEGAKAGGDQSFSWVRGRDTHCAWGAPGEILLQEARSLPRFLLLAQLVSGYPSSGSAAIGGCQWLAASGTTWAVVERVWTT